VGIFELKRRHWFVVGLLVGTTLVLLQMRTPPGEAATAARTRSVAERTVVRAVGRDVGGRPRVRELFVYPVCGAGDARYQYVRGEILDGTPGPNSQYREFATRISVPFRPRVSEPPPNSNYTFRDHLDGKGITYRYAWWTTRYVAVAMWGGGSVILLGGILPMLLGLVRPAPADGEEEYDLERFGRGATEDMGDPSNSAVEGDTGLAALEAELEAAISPSAHSNHAAVAEATQPAPLVPDRDQTPSAPQSEREHHYRGQYYPVDIPERRHE
jgi:hypothetical protein